MTVKRGRPPHDDLFTPAEWRIVHAARHGLSNKVMAERLNVSIDAIKYHLKNILDKTGLPNKKALRQFPVQPKTLAAKSAVREHSMSKTTTITGIGQIARTVSNLQASQDWYELVLEMPHLFTMGNMAFFNCNGTRLMLSQNDELNMQESILYFRVDDIVAMHDSMQKKGVEFIAAPHMIHQHEDSTEEWMAFFKDPDERPLALMSQVKADI